MVLRKDLLEFPSSAHSGAHSPYTEDETHRALPAPVAPVMPLVPALPFDPMGFYAAWMRQVTEALRVFSVGDINIYFPFGSNFTLNADPTTSWGWLYGMATPRPHTEERIVREVASYGKQLGWMMDMLLPLAERSDDIPDEDVEALRKMRDDIDRIKDEEERAGRTA
ncbi:hypothetical protein PB2503_13119 [Parvularcula bermudensis HTCC2503]|uniref:Uncharacterized protein n=1 Tax=Parvularcula bermudensis (strain ATCC BAA-594 / HTCC2503 / KCTC 12087) TaxID=314260 RepID=E0TGQ2_PARBH|nr:hypothetical protein [Parvularcula bermudensis]ADM10661.1 hypothetical protein PB2503_13119 [Parvularcula bermudensis HTCC2503]